MRQKVKQHLCKVEDIASGEMKQFTIKKRPIVVVRKEDEFFAMSGVCPHQGALLVYGNLTGTNLPSDAREYCYGKEGTVIRCGWHNHEFDVTTGISMHDPNSKLKSYNVEVQGEDVIIEV